MRVSVFGMGYVGTTIATCLASGGNKIFAVDKDRDKIKKLTVGVCPVSAENMRKPANNFSLHSIFEKNRYRIIPSRSDDALAESDVCFICVNTPQAFGNTGKGNEVNTNYVREVIKSIGQHLKNRSKYLLVVLKSTVPPGTSQSMIKLLELISGKKCGKDFGFCMNPEFLREAYPAQDFFSPFFTIIGAYDDKSYAILDTLLSGTINEVGVPIQARRFTLEEAEIFKYINNAFHAMKVAFANEVMRICKPLDIDAKKIMDVFCTDKRLNISGYYLTPGQPFGGSCLPKDTAGLQHFAKDVDTPLIDSIIKSNDRHKLFIVGYEEEKKDER